MFGHTRMGHANAYYMNILRHFQAGSAIEGQGGRITTVCMLLLAPQPLQKPQVRTTLMPRPDMVCKENRVHLQ